MWNQIRPALLLAVVLTLVTGVAYPLLVTGVAGLLFPGRASGSLAPSGDTATGSSLIGQPFSDPGYFWGRPSATLPHPYNAAASGGSNLGPSNPALFRAVRTRIAVLRAADPGNRAPVPIDLVTASASGLDPHISPAAALYQVPRVARARRLPEETVRRLVGRSTEVRQFLVLGEPRVNVLLLNLSLDDLR